MQDTKLWAMLEKGKLKVYVLKSLRSDLIVWRHENLQHPGVDRTTETIKLDFTWSGMTKDIEKYVN